MTLEELITLYRAQTRDDAEPYFCSDELLTIYAKEHGVDFLTALNELGYA